MRWSKGSKWPSYIWNFGKAKYYGASWFKMVGMNEDDDISSNARNAGSIYLRGEGVWLSRGLLMGG